MGVTYEKSSATGETMTLTLSSPVEPGGPKAATGSFTFLLRLTGGGSSDLSISAFPAALYNKVWSPTQFCG
ncbi:hypothetical protein HanHA300_Chr11g0402231 [Helianthus annuus]|nr:hypothetical protein HanHA300_Chr11g0402231 [Helianthus annuus]KAJ0517478.1 hypothetical protein HanHA89_Chr11g0425741 [Helianthus annuus]KAJ0685488.1 hypothetical protein HanLR1_Chr11g0403181 [Helianthus annuus]KAJ0689387.1 hypothetical protein HanOQP8_Chr11g0405071 [Helianthus annuus]